MFLCTHCTQPLRQPVTYPCGHSVCSAHRLGACPQQECAATGALPLGTNGSGGHDVTLTKVLALLSQDGLVSSVLDELQCLICYQLLYQPTTTVCQHTFCLACLQRSLDHTPSCPLCRCTLPALAPPAPNVLLLKILNEHCKLQYEQRTRQLAPATRLNTPIFVCQLSFPGLPTFLHLFEPRYRLMLRRALDTPHPAFGMIANDKADYGCMLDIHSVQSLPDGRSMVETLGAYRFRIVERGMLDGYVVARVERVDDIPSPPTQPSAPPLPTLIAHCLSFLTHMHQNSSPWVVQRLSNTYGPPPSYDTAMARPSEFSFYVAVILPIDDLEKAKLLPVRTVELRLHMCITWIESLRKEWWFGQGCVVL